MQHRRSFRVIPILVAVFSLVVTGCVSPDSVGSPAPDCLSFEDLYALVGPESEGFGNWQDARGLAGELGADTEFPDGPLRMTGPGEESGTYDTFVELALEHIAEARAHEGHLSEDDVGTTRKDYSSQSDDNVIIEGVGGNLGTLGWVGYAFASENTGSIRMVEIDAGEGCVAASVETIADLVYPLSRPLYLYVNVAEARNNAAVAAFVEYFMRDESRMFAEEVGYVPLPPDAWASVQRSWQDLGIEVGNDSVSGSVSISGSSTVEPVTGLAAEMFRKVQRDVSMSVRGPGTGDGFAEFCAGEIPITNASREISGQEVERCEDTGVEWIALQVGIDGLAVITGR